MLATPGPSLWGGGAYGALGLASSLRPRKCAIRLQARGGQGWGTTLPTLSYATYSVPPPDYLYRWYLSRSTEPRYQGYATMPYHALGSRIPPNCVSVFLTRKNIFSYSPFKIARLQISPPRAKRLKLLKK